MSTTLTITMNSASSAAQIQAMVHADYETISVRRRGRVLRFNGTGVPEFMHSLVLAARRNGVGVTGRVRQL